jgi:hypothetical protein
MRPSRSFGSPPDGRPSLLDLLIVVLGAGGILLMAPYAALCDRI